MRLFEGLRNHFLHKLGFFIPQKGAKLCKRMHNLGLFEKALYEPPILKSTINYGIYDYYM